MPTPHHPHKPRGDIVKCNDPLYNLFHCPKEVPCKSLQDQCDYEVEYIYVSNQQLARLKFFVIPTAQSSRLTIST